MNRKQLVITITILAILAQLAGYHAHGEEAHWWEGVPGFYAGLSVLASGGLMAAARILTMLGLTPTRREHDDD